MTRTRARLLAAALGLALGLALGSCTDTVAPPLPISVTLVGHAGTTPSTQAVNTDVPAAPAVLVTTAGGVPLVGVQVVFVVTAGGGKVISPVVETDVDGVASSGAWRYGTAVGPQELTAGIVSITADARLVFTGTAVAGPAARLDVTPAVFSGYPADTVTLTADAFDLFSNPVGEDVAATWVSRAPLVASVDADGLVTALAPGTTYVVGTFGLAKDSTAVTVSPLPGDPARIRVDPAFAFLRPGDEVTLRADTYDSYDALVETGVAATWVSRDPAVASIDAAGLVTAVGSGITYLVATLGTFTDSAGVIVTPVAGTGTHPTLTNISTAAVGGTPVGAAISANGFAYVTTLSNTLVRFTLPSSTPDASLPLGSYSLDVVFTPLGDRAYAGRISGGVDVIDPVANTVLRTLAVGGEVLRMAASYDGAYIYATTTDGRVLRISTFNDAVNTLVVGGVLNGLELNPFRGVLYVSSTGGVLTEVNLASFTVARTLLPGGVPQGIAVSPDGDWIYLANEGLGLQSIDASTFLIADTRSAYAGAFDVLVTPDGAHVYVTRYWNSDISVMDAATRAHLLTIPASNPRRMAVTPDGTLVIVSEEGNVVRFIR